MSRLSFVVPFPPSSNTAYYTDKRTNTRHLSQKGRAYKKEVALLIRHYENLFSTSRLHVVYTLHCPDKRKRDIMNFEKVLTDCFSKFIFADDSQIDHFESIRGEIKKGGEIEVMIEEREIL